MDSKEVIEQIENYVKALEILKEPKSKLYTALKEIVPLLQQGKALKEESIKLRKYENMIEGIKDFLCIYRDFSTKVFKKYDESYSYFYSVIEDFEQKYLKEAKQDEVNNK